jgi:hypothetical protein
MTKLTKAEQEVHIWKCADEAGYCAYITDPAELPHYLRLAEKVGGRVIQHQGGTKIFFPQDSVLLQVKRKLNLSPERRAELAARMKDIQATVVE